jgi:serine/threonine protein kinase
VTGEDGKPVELGRGAMGVTYKALDIDLRCALALKVISELYFNDESARLRFLREARTAASLRHPNIASVLYSGRSGENCFYAMELVNGVSLEHLIKRSGRLELKLSLEIATQVVAGLAAVHKKDLVRRDFNARSFCCDTRVCQSRAMRGFGRRHPFESILSWRNALGDADW